MKINIPTIAITATAVTAAAAAFGYFLFREIEETEKVNEKDKKDNKKKTKKTEKSQRDVIIEKLNDLAETNKQSKDLMKKIKQKFVENATMEETFKFALQHDRPTYNDLDYPQIEQVLMEYQNDTEVMEKLQSLIGGSENFQFTAKSLTLTLEHIIDAHTQMRDDIKDFTEKYIALKDKITHDPIIITIVCQAYMEYQMEKYFEVDSNDIECAIYRLGNDLKESEQFRTLNFEIQYFLGKLSNLPSKDETK